MKKGICVLLAVCILTLLVTPVASASASDDGYLFFTGKYLERFGKEAAGKDDTPSGTINNVHIVFGPSLGMVGVAGRMDEAVVKSKLWSDVEPLTQMELILDICENMEQYTGRYGPVDIFITGLFNDDVEIRTPSEAAEFVRRIRSEDDYWLKCLISVPADTSEIQTRDPGFDVQFDPPNINKVSFSADEWMSTPERRAIFATMMILDVSLCLNFPVEELYDACRHVKIAQTKDDNLILLYFATGTHECILFYIPGRNYDVKRAGRGAMYVYAPSPRTDGAIFDALRDMCTVVYNVPYDDCLPIISIAGSGIYYYK